MFDFYNGLTEVIEKNMDNPHACVLQAESYIKNKIGILQKAAETGKKMVRQNLQRYENMSDKDIQSAIEEAEDAMSDPKIAESMNASMKVMNRFMEAMNKFTIKHPAEGEKIADALSEYSSQYGMDSK